MISLSRLSIVQFFLRSRFRREIILILVLKVLALWVLWSFFFSHPVSKELNTMRLMDHYLMQGGR